MPNPPISDMPLSDIMITNSSLSDVWISITKTAKKGNPGKFHVGVGDHEKWKRAVMHTCTIRVYDSEGSDVAVHTIENYRLVSPIGVSGAWDGETIVWNH